jgi:hypothetical protein
MQHLCNFLNVSTGDSTEFSPQTFDQSEFKKCEISAKFYVGGCSRRRKTGKFLPVARVAGGSIGRVGRSLQRLGPGMGPPGTTSCDGSPRSVLWGSAA